MRTISSLIVFFSLAEYSQAAEPNVAELTSLLKHKDAGERVLAAQALGWLGDKAAAAAPTLAGMLDLPPKPPRELTGLVRAVAETHGFGVGPFTIIRFVSLLDRHGDESDDAELVIESAEKALVKIGPKAIPALVDAYKSGDEPRRRRVISLLSQMPEGCREAVPPLIAALEDPSPHNRMSTANQLEWRFASIAESAIPALTEMLSQTYYWRVEHGDAFPPGPSGDPDEYLSDLSCTDASARALRRIGAKGAAIVEEKCLPLLLERLEKAPDEFAIRANAVALREFGPKAKAALPALRRLIKKGNDETLSMLARAIWRIGPDAAPTLRELLSEKDAWLRRIVVKNCAWWTNDKDWKVPLLRAALKDSEAGVRAEAVYALGRLGPAAAPAVDDLIGLLEAEFLDGPRGFSDIGIGAGIVGEALVRIGKPSVKALAKAFDQFETPQVIRLRAVKVIAAIGKPAADALPVLRDGMQENTMGTAVTSMYACVLIDDDKAAMKALIDLLANDKPNVRAYAIYHLGRLGPLARPAEEALVQCLKDESPDVRAEARGALLALGPSQKSKAAIKEYESQNAKSTVSEETRKREEKFLKDLIKQLDAREDWKRGRALRDLKEFGPQAKPALPKALAILKNERSYNRVDAAALLGVIGPDAKEAIPVLTTLSRNPASYLRHAAVEALGDFGSAAKAATPALQERLRDPSGRVRASAAYALQRIAGDSKAALEVYRSMLPFDLDNIAAIDFATSAQRNGLAAIAEHDDSVTPMLEAILRKQLSWSDLGIRDVVAHIEKLGPKAARTVPELVRLLDPPRSPYRDSRADACRALRTIGPPAKDALPKLEKLVDETDPRLRGAALLAIEAIRKK
jgi:HEAT repeat protein